MPVPSTRPRCSCVLVPAIAITLGCSSPSAPTPSGPKVIAVSTHVEVAVGLAASDYVTFGIASDRATTPNTDGLAPADVYEERPGFLFAVPSASSASQAALAAETGIYLAPYLGFGQGIALQGTSYALATGEPIEINATTTLLAFLMMHPDLSHPASDVATAEAQYFVTRLNQGWATLTDCATKYDELLSAGVDPAANTEFAACLQTSLDEVRAGMTAPTPSATRSGTSTTSTASFKSALKNGSYATPRATRALDSQSAPRRFLGVTEGESVAVSSAGTIVGEVAANKSGSEILLEPTTRVGTGLDYLYFVRRLPTASFPQGKSSPSFASPVVESDSSAASVFTAGVMPASSYFSYLDVVGNSLNWLASAAGSTVGLSNDGKIHLTIPPAGVDFYELRSFSGGYGIGTQATIGQYALDHYKAETQSAFRHNVAAAIVELITLVPGADVLLGEDTLGVVVQEATTQAITGLEQLYSTAGSAGLDGTAVYNLLYGIAQTAVTKYIDEASKKAQTKGVKRLLEWVASGGKKMAKLVLSIPGKAAKGGSLANRAFRLSNPESTMELWYVAVGGEGDLQMVSSSEHVTGKSGDGCVFSADLNWTVFGISPTLVPNSLDRFQYSVKGGTSGTLSLSVTNADCVPRTWSTTPGTSYPTQYYEYMVESTARVDSGCVFTGATYDMSGTPIGDVTRTGAFTADGFEGSFTLPAPVHENDFPHIGVDLMYEPIITENTYEINQAGATPTLVSTRSGLHPAKGEVGGPTFYVPTFIVEGI